MNTYTRVVYWTHKIVTASILAVGTYFSITAHFFGMNLVAATFFTPLGESVLTTWFGVAFITGILAEISVPLDHRALLVLRRVVTVYMLMLTLVHGINNLALGNIEGYTNIFSGPVYSYAALVVLGGLAIVIASLPAPITIGSTPTDRASDQHDQLALGGS